MTINKTFYRDKHAHSCTFGDSITFTMPHNFKLITYSIMVYPNAPIGSLTIQQVGENDYEIVAKDLRFGEPKRGRVTTWQLLRALWKTIRED